MARVRAGRWYYYKPTGMDLWDRPYNVKPGDLVQVQNLPGCPKANTMRMCHVVHDNGEFGGLVLTASLEAA